MSACRRIYRRKPHTWAKPIWRAESSKSRRPGTAFLNQTTSSQMTSKTRLQPWDMYRKLWTHKSLLWNPLRQTRQFMKTRYY